MKARKRRAINKPVLLTFPARLRPESDTLCTGSLAPPCGVPAAVF